MLPVPTHFPSDSLMKSNEPSLRDPCKVETRRTFYPDGKLEQETILKGGKRDGVTCIYDDRGVLKESLSYRECMQHGLSRWFYPSGARRREVRYLRGGMQGLLRTWYENGTLKDKWPFKSGKLNGVAQIYYEDGTLKEEIHFRNDLHEGVHIKYHPNGKMSEESFFVNDFLHGRCRIFDAAGNVIKVLCYEHGKLLDGKCG